MFSICLPSFHSFQDCMEIMTKNFKKHGGQLRQFIVDDKGKTWF